MHDFNTAVEPLGPGRYETHLSGNFSIANTPNGGYIMSLLTRAMARDAGLSPETAIVTANYLGRCDDRPCDITVSAMGESGTFLRLSARLLQGGSEKIRAMATFVKPSQEDEGPAASDVPAPPSVSPWDACVPLPSEPGYTLYRSIDLRLDPVCAGWMEGRFTEEAVMKGWVRFREDRTVDFDALAFFADCFPPAVFASRGMVAWVPTIEYSVNVRQLPESRVVKCRFSTRFISRGLVEEDGELWDDAGNLLALSRQIAKYTPVE